MESWYLTAVGGGLGLAVGSFLNVCALRWPQNQSVVSPPSRCPMCERPIRWFENVPVLGWILLRGRCRGCGAPISIQYPLVELATGLIWSGMAWQYGLSWEAARGALFLTLLLGIAVSDARFYVIPNEFSLGGAVLGLGLSLAPGGLTGLQSLSGALLGYGGFWLVGWATTRYLEWKNPERIQRAYEDHDRSREDPGIRERISRFQHPGAWLGMLSAAAVAAFLAWRTYGVAVGAGALLSSVAGVALLLIWVESFGDTTFGGEAAEEEDGDAPPTALGGGDIKMMALIGAFLGPVGVGLTVFLGSVLALASWLPLNLLFRQLIPFGIYLAYGAGLTWAAGDTIIGWYLSFVGLN